MVVEAITIRVEAAAGKRRYFVVGGWPDEVQFTKDLLKSADPAYLRVEGRSIRMTVENGDAVYRVSSEPDCLNYVGATKVSSAWSPEGTV